MLGKLGGEEGTNGGFELQGWSGDSCRGQWENCSENGEPGSRGGLEDLLGMEELEGRWEGSGAVKAAEGCCVSGLRVFPPS